MNQYVVLNENLSAKTTVINSKYLVLNQGPLSPSFLPTTISNTSLWLRADLGTTIATGVSRWADQSGNGNDVVQATGADQPTLQSAGINGLSSLQFNGTSQFLQNLTYSITSPLTILVVAQFAATANVVEMAYSFGNGGAGYLDSSDFDQGQGFNFNTVQLNVTPSGPGNPFIGTGLVNGTETSFYRTANVQQNDLVNNSTVSEFFVGSFGASDFCGKWISEIIIYNKALSPNELRQVWSYLQGRYNLLTVPVSPSTIPGCVLCMDWNSPTVSGSLWSDQSSAHNDFKQPSALLQPTVTTSGTPNGVPVLSFAGAQAMTSAASVTAQTSDWTIFIVQNAGSNTDEPVLFSTGLTNGFGFDLSTGGLRGVLETGVGEFTFGTPSGWELWCNYDTSGVNTTCRVNGAAVTSSGSISPSAGTGGSALGAYNNGAALQYTGSIAAVYVFNRTLTLAEIKSVEDYVKNALQIF